MDFVFDEIFNQFFLFDFEVFVECIEKFVVGVMDCVMGEFVYFDEYDWDILIVVCVFSFFLFLVFVVIYKGKELLDGGISDLILIKKVVQDGYRKNIVVLM